MHMMPAAALQVLVMPQEDDALGPGLSMGVVGAALMFVSAASSAARSRRGGRERPPADAAAPTPALPDAGFGAEPSAADERGEGPQPLAVEEVPSPGNAAADDAGAVAGGSEVSGSAEEQQLGDEASFATMVVVPPAPSPPAAAPTPPAKGPAAPAPGGRTSRLGPGLGPAPLAAAPAPVPAAAGGMAKAQAGLRKLLARQGLQQAQAPLSLDPATVAAMRDHLASNGFSEAMLTALEIVGVGTFPALASAREEAALALALALAAAGLQQKRAALLAKVRLWAQLGGRKSGC